MARKTRLVLVRRRTKVTLTALLLLIWQAGAGFMPGVASVHAHEAPSATTQVAVPDAAPEAEPCHGHAAAETAGEPAPPADVPSCCLPDDCDGACFVGPALSATPAILPVVFHKAWPAPALRLAHVPAFPAEFFRPPI